MGLMNFFEIVVLKLTNKRGGNFFPPQVDKDLGPRTASNALFSITWKLIGRHSISEIKIT